MTKSEQARADALADAETLRRLSGPQVRFLRRCLDSEPFLYPAGSRKAALASSAWWRTFDSLRARGLVERHGDSAVLTERVRAAFRAVPGLRGDL